MGRAKPVDLPSIHFPTQTKARNYFKNMLNRYLDGQRIEEDDHILLYELLLMHPEALDKIGIGVKKFFRAKSPDHPTSCFHLEREDGTKTDFSYIECILGSKPSLEQYFYRACRQSVAKLLTIEKNRLFDRGNVHCCKTNELLTKENSEYRHTSPKFSEIVRDFKADFITTISKDIFFEDSDLQYSTRFANKRIELQFIEFHKKRANLAIFKKYER